MLHFAYFALQEQLLEVNLMLSISRAWYNGSYTMAAKPIKSLELHYTMIQFLIISNIPFCSRDIQVFKIRKLRHKLNRILIKYNYEKRYLSQFVLEMLDCLLGHCSRCA